jgi:hypothetical protein
VDETMAPRSSPTSSGRPNVTLAAQPTKTVVNATPAVARSTPSRTTGRTLAQSVESPPSKRMKARATIPTVCATS